MPEEINRLIHKSGGSYISVLVFAVSLFFLHITSLAQDTIPSSADTTDGNAGQAQAQVSSADGIPEDPAIKEQGQTLFRNNCAVCHGVQQQLVGPALAGITERRPLPWLQTFIKNSQRVIQSGDQYAVQLYEQYNRTEMPSFDFSDEEVLAVLSYIKDQTANPPQETAATTPDGDGTTAAPGGTGLSSGFLIAVMIALGVILLLILVVLVMLVSTLTKYLKQRGGLDEAESELVDQRFSVKSFVRSPSVVFGVSFIFVAIMLKTVIDGLYHIGVQEGYSPTQPIAYSHKVHAGDFAIPCQYCHTGVMESKNAGIPSANICMNCHSAIVKVTGSDTPSAEIQKIYDAVENNQPIEWVRIHNMPDLAYFNHAQHYNVGNVECQTCHGPIETMEVVSQYADLTMGWCIDCHRTTVVQTDNDYYDKLMEKHDAALTGELLVEDVGGLECSKCHY
ncbi:MAG: c-type cytochrome [Cyclobacteriaceae bacterium]|nr:c-type cytochrome [Cyclobacteriaceae bacterium]